MPAILFRRKAGAICLICAVVLTACTIPYQTVRPLPLRVGSASLSTISAQAGARTQVLQPQSPGTQAFSGNGATLDISNATEGYVTVRYKGGAGRVKVQITRSGGSTYTYDLNTGGSYEVFPLTAGDGRYRISVFTQVSGTTYAEALGKTVEVKLRSQLLPFLYPSQYVDFTDVSSAVALGEKLAQNADSELGVIANIYNYVIKNITYDSTKASQVARGELSGYLPVVDQVVASGKGICFDYAAVMAAMLRSQQIPTRLEVGYVSGGTYHAWISVYIKDIGWVNGVIYFDGKNWKLMDPTFASNGSADVVSFIGNGDNYKRQYVY